MSDARPPLSPRKLAANRAKARKSTGPRTAAGKAASACNAYQHGLTGESLALPPDLADAVQAKQAAYEATLRPRNEVERDLARATTTPSAVPLPSSSSPGDSRVKPNKGTFCFIG
jgi:hypothetical protein